MKLQDVDLINQDLRMIDEILSKFSFLEIAPVVGRGNLSTNGAFLTRSGLRADIEQSLLKHQAKLQRTLEKVENHLEGLEND